MSRGAETFKKRAFIAIQETIFDRARALGIIDNSRNRGKLKPSRGKSNLATGIVDSTGFETHHISQHYIYRVKKHFKRDLYRCWPKLSVPCDQKSHLIASAVVTLGSSPDYSQFKTLLKEASRIIHFDRILADAGYDSEENHRFARESLHIRDTVIRYAPRGKARSSGRRRRRPVGHYRGQMKSHFKPRVYAQRAQVESVFSRNKRRMDSFLRSKLWPAQRRECLLHVLTHNLMILGVAE